MYIQSRRQKYMDEARLISRLRPATSGSCLTFWYNMNGMSIGNLNVYKKVNAGRERIWSKSGDHKNRWMYGSIKFQSSKSYQVTFFVYIMMISANRYLRSFNRYHSLEMRKTYLLCPAKQPAICFIYFLQLFELCVD